MPSYEEIYPDEYQGNVDKPHKMAYPGIAVGVLITKDHFGEPSVLLGLRKGSHGKGEWAMPGGKVDLYESPFEAAKRELEEETGLTTDVEWDYGFDRDFSIEANSPCIINMSNDTFESSDRHFVTIFYHAFVNFGIVKNREPEKCEMWKWVPLSQLRNYHMWQATKETIGRLYQF